jgi:hypothetical protein
METPTTEQITKHISAAFDSVNLINKEILKESSEDRKESVERNFQHLEVMLSKEWFSEGLTTEQRSDIDTCITNGKAYIS